MTVSMGDPNTAETVNFAGDDTGGFIFSDFQPSYDAMFAFGKLLEMLAITDFKLSDIASQLPTSSVVRALVRCPWEIKGRIMRVLTKETEGQHVELVDGIKIYRGENWVLVLPDASEPFFHVYAEGSDTESTHGLLCEFVEKIEYLRG